MRPGSRSHSRALAVALAVALTAALATSALALSGCSFAPAAPVESVTTMGGGRSAASITYDGLTLTLTAPVSAIASSAVAVTAKLENTSDHAMDLGNALIGVRGFAESASVDTTTAAFEAGLDATASPSVRLPAGGSKSVSLTFIAPAQGLYKMRGVFGSPMRVKGNRTPALTLTVR